MNWKTTTIHFGEITWELSTARSMYQSDYGILVISDLHIGKAAHFRKHGLQMPNVLHHQDLLRLEALLEFYNPKECIIVGDMVHAAPNQEWDDFSKLRKSFSHTKFILVEGNHDRIIASIKNALNIDTITPVYQIENLIFIHDVKHINFQSDKYYISGHIHPGITIRMPFRKYMKFPCFVQADKHMILPAFCTFTGLDTATISKATFHAFHKEGFVSIDS